MDKLTEITNNIHTPNELITPHNYALVDEIGEYKFDIVEIANSLPRVLEYKRFLESDEYSGRYKGCKLIVIKLLDTQELILNEIKILEDKMK